MNSGIGDSHIKQPGNLFAVPHQHISPQLSGMSPMSSLSSTVPAYRASLAAKPRRKPNLWLQLNPENVCIPYIMISLAQLLASLRCINCDLRASWTHPTTFQTQG